MTSSSRQILRERFNLQFAGSKTWQIEVQTLRAATQAFATPKQVNSGAKQIRFRVSYLHFCSTVCPCTDCKTRSIQVRYKHFARMEEHATSKPRWGRRFALKMERRFFTKEQ